jgi:hypothetical protein
VFLDGVKVGPKQEIKQLREFLAHAGVTLSAYVSPQKGRKLHNFYSSEHPLLTP